MKKAFIKISVLLLILLSVSGCAKEEYMDLYGFSERFTYSEINPTDFYSEKTDGEKKAYYTFFEKENSRVMLKIICNRENIAEEIRIYMPKYDENATEKTVTAQDISLFIKIVSSATEAFTGNKSSTAGEIVIQMQLYEENSYKKEGELTKQKDNFHFVYHSATLGSEFIIYNTYLKAVPETEKPESKPMYGDTTKIRTETVPTK